MIEFVISIMTVTKYLFVRYTVDKGPFLPKFTYNLNKSCSIAHQCSLCRLVEHYILLYRRLLQGWCVFLQNDVQCVSHSDYPTKYLIRILSPTCYLDAMGMYCLMIKADSQGNLL